MPETCAIPGKSIRRGHWQRRRVELLERRPVALEPHRDLLARLGHVRQHVARRRLDAVGHGRRIGNRRLRLLLQRFRRRDHACGRFLLPARHELDDQRRIGQRRRHIQLRRRADAREDGWSGASSTESENPSVSGTSSQTDSYGYHSSGSTSFWDGSTSSSTNDITENGTTTTQGSGWPGYYATTGTMFGGSGSASGTYTTNNNYAPNPYATIDQVNDSWSPGSDGSSTAATISGTSTTYSNDPPNSTSYGPTTASPLNYIPDPWPAFGGPGPEPGAAGVYTAVISQIVPTGGGVDLPGGGDGDGNPAIAASQWDPNSFTYLFGQPTLPGDPSGLLIFSPPGDTIILPAPADVTTYSLAAAGEAVFGMDFAPVAGNGAAQFRLLSPSPPDLRRAQTRFGQGNNPASLPAFTSETIIGGPFGPNRAAAFPMTHSSTLVTYATAGVSAGVTSPATGSFVAPTAVRGSCQCRT